ncbi:hypothetical protein ABXN37_26760 [Piscinibacter sakaiensis]|uniref:hypothetical protein n=1 Tax=Piscinibacter sakaiensis TaxID=1547922 RepID=UPI0037286BDF
MRSSASFSFRWSCTVWYCVPAPTTNQGWPALFASSAAPVTGVPALPATPFERSRVAKVSGWPSLSLRLRFSHHDSAPARSPSAALACQAR